MRLGSAVCALLLVVFSSGCCAFRKQLPPPPPPLSRYHVIEALKKNQKDFAAFVDGSADAKIQHRRDDDWRTDLTFGAVLAFDRGGDDRGGPFLYVRAEKVGMEVFTLKTSGNSFTLRLPDTKEFVYGSGRALDKLPEMIRGTDLQLMTADPDTLGLGPDSASFRWNDENYVFEVGGLTGYRLARVAVDRRELVLKGVTLYDSAGDKTLVVQLRDHERPHEPRDWPTPVPYRIIVKRPQFGLKVTVRLGRPKMKEEIPGAFFKAKAPPGWRAICLDTASVRSIEAFNRK